MLIHVEGRHHFLRAEAGRESGLVRTGIWSGRSYLRAETDALIPKQELDAVTDRAIIVAAFYQAILAIWSRPTEDAFRDRWTRYGRAYGAREGEDEPEPTLPVIRSAILDQVLANQTA